MKEKKLKKKNYYMYESEIEKVEKVAKKNKVTGSIVIRQLVAELDK